jgi:type II secretory pathway pseudopilin PulG
MKMRSVSGFTLVEMLISMTIVFFIAGMALAGIMQLGESANRTKNFVKTRKQLSSFTQGIYNFINRSTNVYFKDGAAEVSYLASYNPMNTPNPSWGNTLYLAKNTIPPSEGKIVYDPTAHTLTYFKDSSANTGGEEMLKDVYSINYDEKNPGNVLAPIFRFPHKTEFYKIEASGTPSASRPLFVVIEFRRRVAVQTSVDKKEITIPVKLACKVDALL